MVNLENIELAMLHDGGSIGGISNYFLNLYDNLKSHNVKCNYYQYFRWKPEVSLKGDINVISGSRLTKEPFNQFSRKVDTTLNLAFGSNWKHFRKGIKEEVILLSNPSLTNLVNYYKNAILVVHDLYYIHKNKDSRILNLYFKEIYKKLERFNLLIANSEHTKKEIVTYLGIEPERIRVVYPYFNKIIYNNKLPLDAPFSNNIDVNKKYILSVGSDQPS